jgi:hypothetical protein
MEFVGPFHHVIARESRRKLMARFDEDGDRRFSQPSSLISQLCPARPFLSQRIQVRSDLRERCSCMNGSTSGSIEIEEGVGEINDTFQNGLALCRLMPPFKKSCDAGRSRGAGSLGTFRPHCLLTPLFLAVIWCSAAWAQIEPGQTVATIPAKDGELIVQNGANDDVWLVADKERVSVNAEEALRVAGWIKEGKMGDYGDTGSVRFHRESEILVVTFAPEKTGKKELRLGEAEALQLAAALASVRQNVSEAGQ